MATQDSMTVGMYSFDCRDVAALVDFWSGVLMRPVDVGGTEAFATIGFDDDGPTWMFHQPNGALPGGVEAQAGVGGHVEHSLTDGLGGGPPPVVPVRGGQAIAGVQQVRVAHLPVSGDRDQSRGLHLHGHTALVHSALDPASGLLVEGVGRPRAADGER